MCVLDKEAYVWQLLIAENHIQHEYDWDNLQIIE